MPISRWRAIRLYLLLLAFPAFQATADPGTDGIEYLNSLRAAAGMTPLSRNATLEISAANHSNYLATNMRSGHFERAQDPGFTGVRPVDRTVYAGYLSTTVSENVSYGNPSVADSIDGLMAAIYHRFTFLQATVDEIGIGVVGPAFTYSLGTSGLNGLCAANDYMGSGNVYLDRCADETVWLSKTAVDGVLNTLAGNNPDIVTWPPNGSTDIPPVFFEETPDPLPDQSVSGYPVSVEFNAAKIGASVAVQRFVVTDNDGQELAYARRILSSADFDDEEFSEDQFVVFPLQRMEWGARYRVHLEYTLDAGESVSRDWYFTTRGLPHRYYRLGGNAPASVDVVSGQDYSFYLVPQNANDTFDSYVFNYSGGITVEPEPVDGNTINIRVSGGLGQEVVFTFSNGRQLTLKIAGGDEALDNIVIFDMDGDGVDDDIDNCPSLANAGQENSDNDPDGDACDNDDDADGLTDSDETDIHGTNPLKADTDDDGMDDRYEVMNGLNPLVNDSAADKDGDGISNLQEYREGSDPGDLNDPIPISVVPVILQLLLAE